MRTPELFLRAAIVLVLAGCTTMQQPLIPPPLELPKKVQEYSTLPPEAGQSGALATQVTETPKPPAPGMTETVKAPPPSAPAAPEKADISLAFEQVPLPTFITTVYGKILKRNVSLDPAVAARHDLITIRTGKPQTPKEVADAARLLLKTYGIAVVDLGTLVRIVPDNAALGYLPEIRRGRALPETPLPLRPIFQLVELQAVRNVDIAQWIRTMFGDKVKVLEDPDRNAVWLSGQSDDVTAALQAIHVLDQPLMRGRHSVRITPAFMSADELVKKLSEILHAEGYSAGPPGGVNNAIQLVPVPAVNAVIAFAGDKAILDHVVAWAKDLDKPGAKAGGQAFFTYQVQNTDAKALAATLDKVLSGAVQAPRPAGTQAAQAVQAAPVVPPRIVVDSATNTIIFQGGNEDYAQLRRLLELLDRPAKEALIEVTVAEVDLTDSSQLGIEWLIAQSHLGGSSYTAGGGTLGGLSLGTAGLNYRILGSAGDTRLVLNALASNNRATILSNPRVVARNGETATIQVGQDVPIITSQQTTPTTGGSGSILQSVEYRTTGVILKVRPVIHSDNEIDLNVSQEVSAAQATNTGVSASPTFQTRKISTDLTLKDGSTVLLGGLISSNSSAGNSGVPLLKDIPGIGQLFRNNTATSDRQELIIVITPYIISNDSDAQAVTDAFRKQLGKWAQTPQPLAPEEGGAKPALDQDGAGAPAGPQDKSGRKD